MLCRHIIVISCHLGSSLGSTKFRNLRLLASDIVLVSGGNTCLDFVFFKAERKALCAGLVEGLRCGGALGRDARSRGVLRRPRTPHSRWPKVAIRSTSTSTCKLKACVSMIPNGEALLERTAGLMVAIPPLGPKDPALYSLIPRLDCLVSTPSKDSMDPATFRKSILALMAWI